MYFTVLRLLHQSGKSGSYVNGFRLTRGTFHTDLDVQYHVAYQAAPIAAVQDNWLWNTSDPRRCQEVALL
jgi:hypothetical protein